MLGGRTRVKYTCGGKEVGIQGPTRLRAFLQRKHKTNKTYKGSLAKSEYAAKQTCVAERRRRGKCVDKINGRVESCFAGGTRYGGVCLGDQPGDERKMGQK